MLQKRVCNILKVLIRVSLFRSFLIFASKQNEAKRILFRFIFACFCETKKKFFCFISHLFASFFFAISLHPFCLKVKNFFCNFAATFLLQTVLRSRIIFLLYSRVGAGAGAASKFLPGAGAA
jgi:hypothetical protein